MGTGRCDPPSRRRRPQRAAAPRSGRRAAGRRGRRRDDPRPRGDRWGEPLDPRVRRLAPARGDRHRRRRSLHLHAEEQPQRVLGDLLHQASRTGRTPRPCTPATGPSGRTPAARCRRGGDRSRRGGPSSGRRSPAGRPGARPRAPAPRPTRCTRVSYALRAISFAVIDGYGRGRPGAGRLGKRERYQEDPFQFLERLLQPRCSRVLRGHPLLRGGARGEPEVDHILDQPLDFGAQVAALRGSGCGCRRSPRAAGSSRRRTRGGACGSRSCAPRPASGRARSPW